MDFGGAPTEGTLADSSRPRLVCIPSSDRAFAALAWRNVDGVRDPAGLERVMRSAYPNARVRRRELSGEILETWYVYRDGLVTRQG